VKVGFPGGPRLEWYDRNPQGVEEYYYGIDLGPHVPVQRFLYTVPTGKKFLLENALALCVRKTVAAPLGVCYGRIHARAEYLVYARMFLNVAGDQKEMNVGRSVILLAGEPISGNTGDASTGGTVSYILTIHGVEFDA